MKRWRDWRSFWSTGHAAEKLRELEPGQADAPPLDVVREHVNRGTFSPELERIRSRQ